MIPARTKDGEKTDAWWDAYEEGYADALKEIEHKKSHPVRKHL
jgi:hypothetical protein